MGSGGAASWRDLAAACMQAMRDAGWPASALLEVEAALARLPEEPAAPPAALARAHPADPRVPLALAEALGAARDWAACLAICEMVLQASPQHAVARRLKLDTLRQARAVAPAARRVRDHRPRLAEAARLRKLGRNAEAVALLRALRAEFPALPGIALELGRALQATGEPEAALAQFDAVLAVQPHHRRAWVARIRALAAARHDGLLPAIEAARALWPDDAWLILRHAASLREGGRAGEAVALLAPRHEAAPDDLDVMAELGRARLALGEGAAGLALLDAVLAAQPAHRAAWDARLEAAEEHPDSAALAGLCRRLHARLLTARDPLAAGRLAELLPRLDLAHWNSETWSWIEAIAANPGEVSPRALWTLYELAELRGLTLPCGQLLAALLDKPSLPLSLATRMLRWSQGISEAHWQDLVPRLRRRVPESQRPLLDLHGDVLARGAREALLRRQRRPGRGVDEILLLVTLLMQASKLDLAMRYLGMARRFHPKSRKLHARHLAELVARGEEEAVRGEVERLLHGPDAGEAESRRMAISLLIALGEARQSLALIDATEDRATRQELLLRHAHLLPRFGRYEEARAVAERAATLRHARRAMHAGATQGGVALAELALADAAPDAAAPAEDALRLVGPSIRALDAWLASDAPPAAAAPGAIPRRVMQYWSQGEPPPELAQIMRGWAEAEGFSYARFNRLGALRFLNEELGRDWAAALRLAGHPAEESDFFRLCWLVVRGGIYADCDDLLVGSPEGLIRGERGLVVFRESRGTIANNLLLAEPAHPVLVHAAVSAKQALLRRDNDSVWSKTGPGLLTRVVAAACAEAAARQARPDVTIHPFHRAGRHVRSHIELDYKKTARYWNAATHGRHLSRLALTLPAET